MKDKIRTTIELYKKDIKTNYIKNILIMKNIVCVLNY